MEYLPGPSIIAWISETSSSFMHIVIPSGGLFIKALISPNKNNVKPVLSK